MPALQPRSLPPALELIAGLKRGSALMTGAPPVPTGWSALDAALGGGLPGGRLTEIVAPRGGKTSLLLALAATATREGRNVAWLDPANAFDVRAAEAAGVAPERLLWIRPASADQAFRAADLVLGSEGFAAAILDLAGPDGPVTAMRERDRGSRILLDASMWNRLARRAEACGVALVVCTERPLAGAAAALGLDVRVGAPRWAQDGAVAPLTLEGADVEVAVRQRKGGTAGFAAAFPCSLP